MSRKHCCKLMLSCGIWINLILLPYSISETVTAEMVCENLTSAKLQYVNGTTKEEMVNVPVSCVEDLNVGCDVDVALISKSLKIYIEKDLKIFQKLRMTINTSLGEEKVLVNGLDIIESLVCLEYRNLSQMLPDDMPVSNDCFGNINQISVLLNNGTVKSHYEMTANETLRLISSAEFLMETNQTFYSILSSAINKYNNLTRSEILLPNSTVSHDDVRVLIVEMKQTIEDNLMNLTNLSDRLIGILEDRTSLIDEIHNLTYNTCHIISRTSLESGFSTVLNECFNNFKRNMRQLVMYIGERRRILRSLKVKTDNISKMIKDFRANNTCNQTKEGPSCCNSSNEWDISGFCTRLNTVIQVHNDVSTSFPLKYNTCYDDLTENKAKVMLSVLEVFLINVTEFQENLEIVCKLQKGLRNISRLENQTTMTGHIICNHVNEILAIVNFTRVSCNDTEFHLEFIQEISDSITGYVNETDNINSQLDDVLFFMQIRPNSLYKQSLKAAINDYTLLTKQTVIYRRTMWKRTAKRIVMEMKETLKQNVQSLNDTEQKLFDEYAAYVEGALILKNMTMQMCHRLNMQISHFKLHNNKLDCETDDRDLNIKLKKSLNVLRRNNIIVRMIKEAIKRLITDLKNYINDHNFENTTYSTTDESTNYVSSTIPSNFSTTMVTLNITIHSSTITSTTDSAINNITNTAITSTTDSAVNNITDTATTSTTESASNNITNSATTPTTDSEVNNITDAATTSTTESAINNITDTATTSATGSAINNITDTATTSTTESASNNITNTATSSTTESASNNITNIATTSTTDTATTSTTDSAINNITDTATTSTTESALNIMTDTTVTSATTLGTSTDTILTSAHSINPVTSTETISKTELDTSTETFDTTAFSSSINTIITTEESSPSPPSKSDNLSPLILPIVLSLSFVLFSW